MMIDVGNFALAGAMLVAAASALAAVHGAVNGVPAAVRLARWLLGGFLALISLSSAALIDALVHSNFQVAYVANYTERALPVGYKIAAFWAGQSGSLLLWAWLLGVVSTLAAVLWRRRQDAAYPWALATLAAVCAFFGALMLFAANPFVLSVRPVADGQGLNPLLQNSGMIAHPPVLFAGYAAFTVPFAALIGALMTGQKDDEWVQPVRRWVLAAWLLLGVGILLGANWAYTELGWGGYWAWDPVENASLLPWLTATGLIHSLVVQRRSGIFRGWNAGLIAGTFLLCIFGTYLTRSGVIQSVHAFEASSIGTFFLVFLGCGVLLSLGLIIWRRNLLKPAQPLDSLLSRDGAFLIANVLLTLIMVVTMVGTIFPIISRVMTSHPMEVKTNFYNTVVAPLAMVVVALMAVGPLLSGGRHAAADLRRRLMLPAAAAVAAVLVAVVAMAWREAWSVVTLAIVVLTVGAILQELIRGVRARMADSQENAATALLRLVDGNHRRYGAQMAHLGIAMLVAGVVGSSVFGQKHDLALTRGQEAEVAGLTFTLRDLNQTRHENYSAVEANLMVTQKDGRTAMLKPQVRYYDKFEQPASEVALDSTLRRDIYVTLAGWKDEGHSATFQVIVNPLVAWIWLGGLVVTLGGIFAMLPTLAVVPAVQPGGAGLDLAGNPQPSGGAAR